MIADKTYLAVPTLTSFTLVRSKIKEGREYTNQLTGQSIQRVETGGRRVEAKLTTYQPVVRDGKIIRYTDLGDDEFTYPETAPVLQAEAGGDPVTTMDELLDESVIKSLRDVLVEVMTGSIPDFADQPGDMSAVGVPRFFHIDRIQFDGRADRPKEAALRVLLGVYADAECTQLRRYIQQDFVSASLIDEKQQQLDTFNAQSAILNTELAASTTTDERKQMLRTDITRVTAQIAQLTSDLNDLQPLSAVVAKPAIESAIREITEAVLIDAVETRTSYKKINVAALMERFDNAFATLVAAVS